MWPLAFMASTPILRSHRVSVLSVSESVNTMSCSLCIDSNAKEQRHSVSSQG